MVGPSPSMVLYLERWLGREPGFVGLDLGLGVAMEGPSFLEKVVGLLLGKICSTLTYALVGS